MGLGWVVFSIKKWLELTQVFRPLFYFYFLHELSKAQPKKESLSYTGPTSKVRSKSLVRVYKVFGKLFMAKHAKASHISKQRMFE